MAQLERHLAIQAWNPEEPVNSRLDHPVELGVLTVFVVAAIERDWLALAVTNLCRQVDAPAHGRERLLAFAVVPDQRGLASATFRLRLQPTEPGWVDMALSAPVMDTTRAREQLGWSPKRTATATLLELLAGMSEGAGVSSPPLDPATSGPLRIRAATMRLERPPAAATRPGASGRWEGATIGAGSARD